MSKGDLEKFELSLDESTYLSGEDLYDQSAVCDLIKGESNLYTANVVDEGITYEVEIQNPASLQRKSTCDCKSYQSKGNCPHIVAALLAIRRKITKPKSPKKRVKSKKQEHKFNARVIAGTLTVDEMRAFLIDYSRRDRKFDLFLKAKFSKKIEMVDNSTKYKAIVDALIPPAKNSDYKISKASVNHVMKFFEEFLIQIEDSLAMKQFKEAFEIFDPVFKKISYVRHYSRDTVEKLEEINIKYHKILLRILRTQAAPELIEEIKLYMLSLASYSYYNVSDFSYNMLYMLYAYDQNYIGEISDVINEEVITSQDPLNIALYFYFNENKLNEKVLAEWYNDQTTLIRAMEILIDNKCESTAKVILDIAHTLGWKNSAFDDIYLSIMKLDNNYQEFISYAIAKLLETQQFYFYRLMINKLEPELYNMAYDAIDKVAPELDSDLICRIHAFNKNFDSLMKNIISREDIFLAMKYDDHLISTHAEALTDFYLRTIENYLDNHMGYEADRYVNNILDHLRIRNNKTLIRKIKKMISEKYPHRKRFLQLHQ
jgi:hypothetical protein